MMSARPILLVEDEKEKGLALIDALASCGFDESQIQYCDSVRSAVLEVLQRDFEIVILDVSLPTYGPDGMIGSAGRAQQQSGGLEVLRTLNAEGKKPSVIIVTQHPDILFSGESVKLQDVRDHAEARYGQNVISAILYRESDSSAWRKEFSEALREIR